MKSPYEKFAEVYDLVMPDKFYEDYYQFVAKVLQESKFKPRKILELACGTGKLAKIFLDKGYNIEGLDLSQSMLNIAEKKGLKIYQNNMVDFDLDRKYDLILCIYDSLNYIQKQSDLQQCFNSVNKHLNRDGLFIFDMNSPFKINKIIPSKPIKTQYFNIGNVELVWLNSHEPDTWIAEMIFFEKTEDGKYQRFYEKHIEKAYKLSAITGILGKEKFKLVASYSDFQFNKIKRNSGRWFFVCKKKSPLL